MTTLGQKWVGTALFSTLMPCGDYFIAPFEVRLKERLRRIDWMV